MTPGPYLATSPNNHYLHELPFADEQRLEALFKKLDKDSNGRIDIHDLSAALKELGLCGTYAEVSGDRGFRSVIIIWE